MKQRKSWSNQRAFAATEEQWKPWNLNLYWTSGGSWFSPCSYLIPRYSRLGVYVYIKCIFMPATFVGKTRCPGREILIRVQTITNLTDIYIYTRSSRYTRELKYERLSKYRWIFCASVPVTIFGNFCTFEYNDEILLKMIRENYVIYSFHENI